MRGLTWTVKPRKVDSYQDVTFKLRPEEWLGIGWWRMGTGREWGVLREGRVCEKAFQGGWAECPWWASPETKAGPGSCGLLKVKTNMWKKCLKGSWSGLVLLVESRKRQGGGIMRTGSYRTGSLERFGSWWIPSFGQGCRHTAKFQGGRVDTEWMFFD